MKIALLEPLNVSEEMLREMAAPVLERGHELTDMIPRRIPRRR